MPTDSPEALAATFTAAVNAGEVQSAVELWLEDAAIVRPDGQTARGRQAVGETLQTLVDGGVKIEIDLTRVFEAGDVATVLGTLTLKGVDSDGAAFTQTADSVVVYSRGPDGWRIAIDAPWGLPAP